MQLILANQLLCLLQSQMPHPKRPSYRFDNKFAAQVACVGYGDGCSGVMQVTVQTTSATIHHWELRSGSLVVTKPDGRGYIKPPNPCRYDNGCPDGWTNFDWDNNKWYNTVCLKAFDEPQSFEMAQATCHSLGGHIITAHGADASIVGTQLISNI